MGVIAALVKQLLLKRTQAVPEWFCWWCFYCLDVRSDLQFLQIKI
jgi:hypothetical protein